MGGTDSRASPKPQRQRTLDDDAVQTTTKPDNSKAFEVHGVGPVFFHNCQQASLPPFLGLLAIVVKHRGGEKFQ